jgi:DNA-binding transcriptional LysR family regulator
MRLNPRRFSVKLSDGDIRRLRVFCTVTRCGGFAAAESELQMGLPSISRYIKDLEIRLGVRLCRRGRVGFELTEQGRNVYSASLQLIADLKRFEANMRSIHSALAGTLTIGIIDTLITDRNLPLPRILRDYKCKHPQVEFDLQTKTANVIERAVIEGSLDAGLVIGAGFGIGRRHINQLDYQPLYHERHNLYCSEEHPLYRQDPATVTIEEVSKHDYAGYSYLQEAERTAPTRLLLKTACVDSVEAMATLVSSGCFLAMLPDHYVESVWRLKSFKPILPEVFSVAANIELVTRHGTSAPLVQALLDFVEKPEPAIPQPKVAARAATVPLLRTGSFNARFESPVTP